MNVDRAVAARERSQNVRQQSHRPPQRRNGADIASARATAPLTARLQVIRAAAAPEAAPVVTLEGVASAYEQPYEMWDAYGPYTEVVSAGAGEKTLKADPDVKYLFNHRGMPMASTRTDTLTLVETDNGLHTLANPLMTLATSVEVVLAVEAGLINEMSFAFTITRGSWNADYTEYRIHEYNIDRGDVSPVTYGANPFTSIDTRSQGDDDEDESANPNVQRLARLRVAARALDLRA